MGTVCRRELRSSLPCLITSFSCRLFLYFYLVGVRKMILHFRLFVLVESWYGCVYFQIFETKPVHHGRRRNGTSTEYSDLSTL